MHLLVAVLLIFKYPAPSMTSDIQYVYEINEKKKTRRDSSFKRSNKYVILLNYSLLYVINISFWKSSKRDFVQVSDALYHGLLRELITGQAKRQQSFLVLSPRSSTRRWLAGWTLGLT